MIVELFLNLLILMSKIVNFIVPDWKAPESIYTPIVTLFEKGMAFDMFLPISEMVTVIQYILVFEISIITLRLIASIVFNRQIS